MNIQQLPSLSSVGLYNACEGSLYYVTPYASQNLCTNPSFEDNLDDWTLVNTSGSASVGLSNTRIYAGFKSARLFLYAGDSFEYTTPVNVLPGKPYVTSFYMFNSSGIVQSVSIEIIINSTVVSVYSETLPIDKWVRVIVPFVGVGSFGSPAYPATLKISGVYSVYMDAVQIEYSEYGATTYFDGDNVGTVNGQQTSYPQYTWTGNRNSSISYRSRQATNGGVIHDLAKYGFEVISISGAGNPTFDNNISSFAGTDGGVLHDMIVGPRDVTIVGRISAYTKDAIHQKLQQFMNLFKRDDTAFYQERTFFFQHKSGRQSVGQMIRFQGVLSSAVSADVNDQLSVDVTIQITMIDPYFYGHDVATEMNPLIFDVDTPNNVTVFDYYDNGQYQYDQYGIYETTDGRFRANGDIYAIHCCDDGTVYIGGNFTTIYNSINGITYSTGHIARFEPISKTFLSVAGNVVYNNDILTIASTPDGSSVFIGGSFTTVNGVAANRIIRYDAITNTYDYITGFNNNVYSIYVDPTYNANATYKHKIIVGGQFTQLSTGTTMNRISFFITSWQVLGGGAGGGVNNTVWSVCYDPVLDYIALSGNFTATVSGTNMRGVGLYGGTPVSWVPFTYGTTGYARTISRFDVGRAYFSGPFTAFVDNDTGAIIESGISDVLVCEANTLYQILSPRQYGTELSTSARAYRNGVLYAGLIQVGTIYSAKPLQYYDANTGITTYLPIITSEYHDVDKKGRIYYCNEYDHRYTAPKAIRFSCQSTVATSIKARFIIDVYEGVTFLLAFGNTVNNKTVTFRSAIDSYIRGSNVIAFNSKNATMIEERSNSSILSTVEPNSNIYDMKLLPGENFLYVSGVNTINTSTTIVSNEMTVLFAYTQTYQSIFDGINSI